MSKARFSSLTMAWDFLKFHQMYRNNHFQNFHHCFDFDVILVNKNDGELATELSPDTQSIVQMELGLSPGRKTTKPEIQHVSCLLSIGRTFEELIINLANNIFDNFNDKGQKRKEPYNQKVFSKTIAQDGGNVFFKSWRFVYRHAIFADKYGNSRFHELINMCIFYINPEAWNIDHDNTKNTLSMFEITVGIWSNLFDNEPLQMFYEDNDLVVEAITFEQAFLLLANCVYQKYGYNP